MLPGLYAAAYLHWKRLGYLLSDGRLWVKRGVLTREWTVAEAVNAQVVSVAETPFDRRYGVRTVRVYLAATGAFGSEIRVEALDRPDAENLAKAVAKSAAEKVWETSVKA